MGITLARRRCADCCRTLGFGVWSWSGRLFVTSHGLCRGCVERRCSCLCAAGRG